MSEPIVITVKRYKCPHCSRSRTRRNATAEHIARCWFNPDNRTCKTCFHYYPGDGGPVAWCEPGRPCACNEVAPSCDVGVLLPEGAAFPVTGCPMWKSRDDEPDSLSPVTDLEPVRS